MVDNTSLKVGVWQRYELIEVFGEELNDKQLKSRCWRTGFQFSQLQMLISWVLQLRFRWFKLEKKALFVSFPMIGHKSKSDIRGQSYDRLKFVRKSLCSDRCINCSDRFSVFQKNCRMPVRAASAIAEVCSDRCGPRYCDFDIFRFSINTYL